MSQRQSRNLLLKVKTSKHIKLTKGYIMKKIAIILSLLFLTNSAFAGSCPMMANNIDSKIEEAQKLRDAGVKAHEDGKHAESEKLLNQALQLFKGSYKNGIGAPNNRKPLKIF